MPKKSKEIPIHDNDDATRKFWSKHDSTEYIDWDKAESVILPKLKPTTKTISLRMSSSMLDKIRVAANKRDVPYQSLIKTFLQERIDEDLKVN